MDRRRFLSVMATAAATAPLRAGAASSSATGAYETGAYETGLLWQIGKPGVRPSYVFGTLHLPDARLLPLPEPVARAFAECRRLIVEMLPNPGVARRFGEAMQLEGGAALDAMLGADHFDRLVEHLARRGYARESVTRLKPWAALLQVSARPGGDPDEQSLDTELFLRARFANKPVEELDTVEEQIAVFDDIPQASQLALLAAAIDFHPRLAESAERVMQAYLVRDLAAITRAGRLLERAQPALAEHQRMLEKKVIADRSVVMAYRLQYYLRRGESFAAIGASHLHGPAGVPALLADEYEWRVRRLW